MAETTQIQRKYAVAQDTAPVSPFAGQLWRDTINNVLKVYDETSSSWKTVSSSPDGVTVFKNAKGNLEADVYDSTRFQDWVNNNNQSWSTVDTSGNYTISINNDGIYFNCTGLGGGGSSNYVRAYRTIDVTDYDALEITYSSIQNGYGIDFLIDGTHEASMNQEKTNAKFTVDVSSMSGNITIEFRREEHTSSGGSDTYVTVNNVTGFTKKTKVNA